MGITENDEGWSVWARSPEAGGAPYRVYHSTMSFERASRSAVILRKNRSDGRLFAVGRMGVVPQPMAFR